jgi:hypothetical protein
MSLSDDGARDNALSSSINGANADAARLSANDHTNVVDVDVDRLVKAAVKKAVAKHLARLQRRENTKSVENDVAPVQDKVEADAERSHRHKRRTRLPPMDQPPAPITFDGQSEHSKAFRWSPVPELGDELPPPLWEVCTPAVDGEGQWWHDERNNEWRSSPNAHFKGRSREVRRRRSPDLPQREESHANRAGSFASVPKLWEY